MSSIDLKAAIGRLGQARARGEEGKKLDLAPGCTFGAVVEQRLKAIEGELAEVKGRLNGLIYLVASAVVVEVVMRLVK